MTGPTREQQNVRTAIEAVARALPDLPTGDLVTGLGYVLARLIATQAPDLPTAIDLVWRLADTQVAQIREWHGRGQPH